MNTCNNNDDNDNNNNNGKQWQFKTIIIVVFGEMGIPEHQEKNLLEENREPTSSIQI